MKLRKPLRFLFDNILIFIYSVKLNLVFEIFMLD